MPDLGVRPDRRAAAQHRHLAGPAATESLNTQATLVIADPENILRLAGKLRGDGGSFEGGVAAVKQFLLQAGLKEDEFTFLDGSGLSAAIWSRQRRRCSCWFMQRASRGDRCLKNRCR